MFVPNGSGGLERSSGIIFGPEGNLYVASTTDDDSVLRYDGATGAFIDEFVSTASGGLAGPQGLVFGPDGHLYVASNETDNIRRYDGTTGALIGEFVTAGSGGLEGAGGVLFGPDGNGDGVADLYVTGTQADGVFRYDGVTGAPLAGPFGSPGTAEFVTPGNGGLDLPFRMAYGPDGRLYVASTNTDEILRYDETTGDFIDVFVPAASGGLDQPRGLAFGADGFFYVSSAATDQLLRYDGTNGNFVDVLATGATSLSFPRDLLFDSSGNLLISSSGPCCLGPGEVLRYSEGLTVSLSAASALPVTVDFATTDGSATAGNDYTGLSGKLTFAPGETTQKILIPAIDDAVEEPTESFFVNLSAATGAVIQDNQGEATILDDDAPAPSTKFYVVDDSADDMYEYMDDGSVVTNYDLGSGNNSPRGAAATVAGDTVWVIDNDDHVYVHDADGNLQRSWKANGLNRPEGIATDGTAVWIVDRGNDRVHYFEDGATRIGDTGATSSFSLQAGDPRGITTDGTYLWVVDAGTDDVYKYSVGGALLGNWALDSRNTVPRGITIDPGNVSDIWVIDSMDDDIYQYTAAAGLIAGSQSANTVLNLAAGNTNPQGIADPPPATQLGAEPGPTLDTQPTDGLFAAVALHPQRPANERAVRVRSQRLAGSSTNSTANVQLLATFSSDTLIQTSGDSQLSRPRLQSRAVDQVLDDLAVDDILSDDLLDELAAAHSVLK